MADPNPLSARAENKSVDQGGLEKKGGQVSGGPRQPPPRPQPAPPPAPKGRSRG